MSKLVSSASRLRLIRGLLRRSGSTREATSACRESARARAARCASVFRLPAEEREDGEHAAVVVLGVRQAQLLEDRLDVALDLTRREEELLADRAVRAALGDEH